MADLAHDMLAMLRQIPCKLGFCPECGSHGLHRDGCALWGLVERAGVEGPPAPDPLRLWRAEFPGHIATGSALIVAADEPDALAMLAGRMRAAGLDPAGARLRELAGRRVPGVATFDDGGA